MSTDLALGRGGSAGASATGLGGPKGWESPARNRVGDRLGARRRPSWQRLPSLGFALSLALHAAPVGVLLMLGHAASEPPRAASGPFPSPVGIEVAVAFGLPRADTLPDVLPTPILAPAEEGAPVVPEPEQQVAAAPVSPADVGLLDDPPPAEAVTIHQERPKPQPKPRKAVRKAGPNPGAPAAAPQQAAATPVGTLDAPRDSEASGAPAAAEPARGASAAGAATGPASPADAGPLVILDPAYREPPSPPSYPPRSVVLGQQGQVVVRAAIDPRGNPEDVVVWTSSGFPLLDKAAIDAVRRWRFMPASRGGAAVAAWVQVPVNFKLR